MERINEQLSASSASLIIAGPLSNGRSMTRNPLPYSFMYFEALRQNVRRMVCSSTLPLECCLQARSEPKT